MSREWYEKEYVSASKLWEWLDEVSHNIELMRQELKGDQYHSTLPELVFLGRKEMVQQIGTLVHQEEISLKELLRFQGIDAASLTDEGDAESYDN